MKPKVVFVIILFWVLFISTPASAQQEEITLSTYYPAPFGEYDELCAEKLLVDLPSAQELQDMARGDCHITRSLIVGAGGTGFSYDEIGGSLTDGTVLIKGDVGIGTTNPSSDLHIIRSTGNADITIENTNPTSGQADLLLKSDNGDNTLRLSAAWSDNNVITSLNYAETASNPLLIQGYAGGAIPNFGVGANRTYFTGNVIIGTTANPQNRLDIEGALAVGANYSGTSAAPSNGAIIEGNVGIGTTSPTAKLHVAGTAGTDGIKFPDGSLQTTAWGSRTAQAIGATDIAASAPEADMPDMSVTLNTGTKILVMFSAQFFNSSSGPDAEGWLKIYVDGIERRGLRIDIDDRADFDIACFQHLVSGLTPGSHTVRIRWVETSGDLRQRGLTDGPRVLTVVGLD